MSIKKLSNRFLLSLVAFMLLLPVSGIAKSKKQFRRVPAMVKKTNNDKSIVKTYKGKHPVNLVFEKKYEKEARNRVLWAYSQLKGAKTYRQWMDQSKSRKNKLHRRSHFSSVMNKKIPSFSLSKYSILFVGTDKKKHLISVFPDKRGILNIFDGIDITPKKNEGFSSWKKRTSKLLKLSASISNPWLDLLFPKAYALGSEDMNFVHAITSMTGSISEWEDHDFSSLPNALALAEFAFEAVTTNGLRCDGTTASFRADLGGVNQSVMVRQPENDNAYVPIDIHLMGRRQAVGTFSVPSNGQAPPHFINYQTQQRYRNSSILNAVSATVNGGSLDLIPEGDPSQKSTNPVTLDDAVAGIEATRACTVMKEFANVGLDLSLCHRGNGSPQAVNPEGYAQCLRENYIGAGLAGRVTNIGNSSPLRGMSRSDAMAFKVRLLEAFSLPNYRADYSPSYPVTYAPGGGELAYESSGIDLMPNSQLVAAFERDVHSESEQAIVGCIRNAVNNTVCSVPNAPRELETAFQRLPLALGGSFDGGNPTGAYYEGVTARESAPDGCGAFLTNNTIEALEDYRLADATVPNEPNGHLDLVASDLDRVVHLADVGRACCGNNECREFVRQGGTPVYNGVGNTRRSEEVSR